MDFTKSSRTVRSVLRELNRDAPTTSSASSSSSSSSSSASSPPPAPASARVVTAVVLGCGARGTVYSNYAVDFPQRLKLVAVCDVVKERCELVASKHQLPHDKQFQDWNQIIKTGKIADAVLICTPDRHHHAPTIAFAKQGYHILCEKPMSVDLRECEEMVSAVQKAGVVFSVCHLMRYSPSYRMVKAMLEANWLGRLLHIQHLEPVGHTHFAHSFVRGNWNNTATSTFSFMSKTCHDFDVVSWWMGGAANPVVAVSAMGSLKEFHPKNKPPEAADRCLDCKLKDSCIYSAKKEYLDPLVQQGYREWPISVLTAGVPDIESVTSALRTGPYGRCVWSSDNNVADQQVATLQFQDGTCGTITMVATSRAVCQRVTRIFGSEGELESRDGESFIWTDFRTRQVVHIRPPHHRHHDNDDEDAHVRDDDGEDEEGGDDVDDDGEEEEEAKFGSLSGHGGADFYFMDAFVRAVSTGDTSLNLTGPTETLTSHRIVFDAERARITGRRILCNNYDAEAANSVALDSTSSSSSSSSSSTNKK